jgi:hypothetical protein
MKKSELYARYHHWQNELIEIDDKEFNVNMVADNKDNMSFKDDGSTYVIRIRLEGWDYYSFSSMWQVGWQGDVDCDNFYCKIKTITHAEMEEIALLFNH